MTAVLWLIGTVIHLYTLVLVASAILAWMIALDVINPRNRVVYIIGDFLHRMTESALRPIRSIIPNMGGIDISAIILILCIAICA